MPSLSQLHELLGEGLAAARVGELLERDQVPLVALDLLEKAELRLRLREVRSQPRQDGPAALVECFGVFRLALLAVGDTLPHRPELPG